MVVIYTCYGGSHSSVAAAAIHTRLLHPDKRPSLRALMALEMFDRSERGASDALGHIRFVGRDARGNEVFVLGLGPHRDVLLRAILEALAAGRPSRDVLVVDTLHLVGTLARVGGTLSRGLGLIWPGRAIVAAGILRCYKRLSALVGEVESWLAAGAEDGAGRAY